MPRSSRRVGARFVAFLRADFAGVRAGFVALLISSGGDLVTGLTLGPNVVAATGSFTNVFL